MNLSIDAQRDSQSVTPDWRVVATKAIDGVEAREVKHVLADNGTVLELLRTEWLGDSTRVDQVMLRTIDPGSVSAWHVHRSTIDRLFCVAGRALVVLYDARQASPTHRELTEYRLGPQCPTLLIVPPGVFHGVKALGAEPAMLINMVNEAYSYAEPDHWRLPPDTTEIPYRFL
jgi:dTDP-4-dehydrorhamnose 3,5-epimerase